MNKKINVWLLGAALGVGVSAVPAFAERIDKKDVPNQVLPVLQGQLPPGAKGAEYHSVERDGKKAFEVRFETADGRKTKAVVSRDGQLLEPAAGVAAPTTPPPVTPIPVPPTPVPPPALTPAPAVGSMTPDQARAELTRLRAEEDKLRVEYDGLNLQAARLVDRHNALEAAARGGDKAAVDERQRLVSLRNEIVTESRRLETQIAALDQREAQVAAAGGIQNEQVQLGSAIGTAVGDADDKDDDIHYARANRTDVPEAALRSLDKFTQGARDLWYRKEEINGKGSFGVHYVTADNKRHWASAYPSGEVRVQPKLSIYQPGKPLPPGAVPPEFPIDPSPVGAVADNTDKELRVQTITREQVPPVVLAALDQLTKGNKNIEYRRDTKGSAVSYTSHYVSPDNKRYFVNVSEAGKATGAPQLSNTQPTAVKPLKKPAGGAVTGGAPAGGGAAAGLKPLANSQVPKEVSTAFMKAAGNKAADWQFFRAGQDDFAAHFTKDGKKFEIRVDESGKVLSGPTAVQ
jgi:hypothetical protein